MFLIGLMTINPLQKWTYGKSTNKSATNNPVFTSYVYQGEDQVYENNPLKSDEFLIPFCRDAIPTRPLPEKAMIITWLHLLFTMFPEFQFSIRRFGELDANRTCARPKIAAESAGIQASVPEFTSFHQIQCPNSIRSTWLPRSLRVT